MGFCGTKVGLIRPKNWGARVATPAHILSANYLLSSSLHLPSNTNNKLKHPNIPFGATNYFHVLTQEQLSA
jgi:hypothetical protein